MTPLCPSYFADINQAADMLINFYNPRDWVLDQWRKDQNAKPDDFGYGYTVTGGFTHDGSKLFFPDDRYEIFAFADQARSFPLGQEPKVGGPFNTSRAINLSLPPYSFRDKLEHHAGQVNYPIQHVWAYWNALLHTSFGL